MTRPVIMVKKIWSNMLSLLTQNHESKNSFKDLIASNPLIPIQATHAPDWCNPSLCLHCCAHSIGVILKSWHWGKYHDSKGLLSWLHGNHPIRMRQQEKTEGKKHSSCWTGVQICYRNYCLKISMLALSANVILARSRPPSNKFWLWAVTTVFSYTGKYPNTNSRLIFEEKKIHVSSR